MKNILKKISFLLLSFVYLQQNNAEIISATWLQNNQTGQNIFLYGDEHLVRPANAVQIEKITNSLLPNTKESSIIFVENYNPGIQTEENKLQILLFLTKTKNQFPQIEFVENRRIVIEELLATKQIINFSKNFFSQYNKKSIENTPFSFLIGSQTPFISDTRFYINYLYPKTGGRMLAHQEIQYLKNELEKNEEEIKQILSDLQKILSRTTICNISEILNKLNNDLYEPIYEEYGHLLEEAEDPRDYIRSQLRAIEKELHLLQINPTIPSFDILPKEVEVIINDLEKKLYNIRSKIAEETHDYLYSVLEQEKNYSLNSVREFLKIQKLINIDCMGESISYILREQFETLGKNEYKYPEKEDHSKKRDAVLVISGIEKLANIIRIKMLTLFDISTIIKILESQKQNIIIFAGATHTNNISKVLTTYTNNFEIVATQGKTIFKDEIFIEWEKISNHLYYQHPYWKKRTVNLDVFDWPLPTTFNISSCLDPAYFKTENQSNKRKRQNDPTTKRQRLE